jgi:hypothetical protein
MMRYVEYAYLVAAIGIGAFMVMSFKDLETSNKVMLSFAVMLCAFMYTFRRKQRLLLDEMDARRNIAHNDDDTEEEAPMPGENDD